ncbi:MAG: methionyl-tRNA formyltransferase, partial [Candidatus Omnitrophica bacterium]|nr:methionyl-tRNA formyltransferase [Candidatus Omnitrophota bacterium]
MRILFFGTGGFGLPALDFLKDSPQDLLGVVTSPDKPRGRNLKTAPSPVKAWALARGIPVLGWESLKGEAPRRVLKNAGADLFVVADYGLLLPEELLAIPKRMALNIHASLLPRYRGAAPIQWAILNGEKTTGVTVFKMTAALDAGDILIQKEAEISPEEDAVSLEKKLSEIGGLALSEALSRVGRGEVSFVPQDERQVSLARKITKEDGRIDWSGGARRIRDQVRALAPWPGAWTFYEGKRILVRQASLGREIPAAECSPG